MTAAAIRIFLASRVGENIFCRGPARLLAARLSTSQDDRLISEAPRAGEGVTPFQPWQVRPGAKARPVQPRAWVRPQTFNPATTRQNLAPSRDCGYLEAFNGSVPGGRPKYQRTLPVLLSEVPSRCSSPQVPNGSAGLKCAPPRMAATLGSNFLRHTSP